MHWRTLTGVFPNIDSREGGHPIASRKPALISSFVLIFNLHLVGHISDNLQYYSGSPVAFGTTSICYLNSFIFHLFLTPMAFTWLAWKARYAQEERGSPSATH